MNISTAGGDVLTQLQGGTPAELQGATPLALNEGVVTRLPQQEERLGTRKRTLGQPIPEGDGGSIARRDAAYRFSLLFGDIAAAAFAVAVGVLVIGHLELNIAAFAAPLLMPILCKACGLYDRDQHLIRKTTLDEIPSIFQVATLYTLMISLVEYQLFNDGLQHKQILALWTRRSGRASSSG